MNSSDIIKTDEYGIYKFKMPQLSDYSHALGLAGESTLLKKLLTYGNDNLYNKINSPDYGDWLMHHKEYGQTYQQFIANKPRYLYLNPNSNNFNNIIYLVSISYSENTLMNNDFIMSLKILTQSYFYGMKVKILNKVYDINKYNISTKMNIDTGKIQICSEQILQLINNDKLKDAYCIIAFTDQDLFLNKYETINNVDLNKDTLKDIEKNLSTSYAFSLSCSKQGVSIFSFARYDPLFYCNNFNNKESDENYDKKNRQNTTFSNNIDKPEYMQKYFNILLKRSCKSLIKEICNMMGLKNCIYYECVLNGYMSLQELDSKPLEVCPICLRKIYFIIQYKNIGNTKYEIKQMDNPIILYERWIKLKDTLEDYFENVFDEELQWYKNKLFILNNDVI